MEISSDGKRNFKEKRRLVINVLFQFIPTMMKVIPGMTMIIVVCNIISSLIPVVQIYLVKELIDEITALFESHSSSLLTIYLLLGIQGTLLLLDKLIQFGEKIVGFRAQQHLKFYFEHLLVHKSSKLPLRYFDRPAYFDQLERAALGMDIRGFSIFVLFMNALRNSISIIGMLSVLLSFHLILALVVLLMLIPSLWVNLYFGQRKYMQMINQTPTQRKTHYLLQLLHSRHAAKEFRIYQHTDYIIGKWTELFWKTTDERYQLEKTASWRALLVGSVQSFLNIGTFGILVWFGYQGLLTIGHYVSLTQALVQIEGFISGLGRNIAGIYEESLFVSEVLQYLHIETEEDKESKEDTVMFPSQLHDCIEVRDLTFSYSNQSKPILKNITFRVAAGEKIAIVGENGAGKSTLVKCLLGLYFPNEGSITYDGIEIRAINTASLRENVSAVFQDYVNYQLTARENIAMGKLGHIHDDAMIMEAADNAGAGEILRKLPQGMDTVLGAMFEGGHELSGGQWQKIALSRAFMKQAQFMILDEPTAALDPKSEAEVYDHFMKLCEGKTTIMISHRLSSCRHADRIIVLHDGEIIEEGSHVELIHKQGNYAEMFASQAGRYSA
ncbi:ATP-binding cassette, subfamily B [Paenibacillus sp. cl6col]|uniref:ABC transporter ATP-binding protein n=1 Tax=Paenibacillus sp. cl6col TaxID=1761878 RepID=UPI000887F183|nr:ABC transporter ATP-binding protein [Paenibacillus sp. cl6col]SDE65578.1 ATP-binding cassette, subfamily B [Paenibacillus sp. cl6col]